MAEIKKLPVHIAFIMDGNGRWAKQRLLPRKMGHREGVKAMKTMIKECEAMGIGYVTFYAFSTENWARPQEEIDELFSLVKKFADNELKEYSDKGYRIRILGDVTQLPSETRDALEKIMLSSRNNTGMCVNVAINYGGRQEIVNAVNNILQSGITQIDAQSLSDCMYTCGIPDPDVIVRSGGEKRLSNFLIWQCAYSELIFVDKYWPDFDRSTLEEIIAEYAARDRRYGKITRLN
ncbi:MAG: polyprenyl diphosphate synthase [Christensenellales bacterium]